MKRKPLITLLSTSLLLFGALSVVALTTNKNKYKEAEASSMVHSNGTFVRVNSIGELALGDKVIFVSTTGYAMDDIWGNPGYLHGGQGGVSLSQDLSTVTLTDSDATIFTVELGTDVKTFHNIEQQSYAFRADVMSITGQRKKNIYFAHNEKLYYDDDTFECIGHFKDRDIAVETKKNREASWFIEFSTEDDYRYTHIRNAKSVMNDDYESEVKFTTYYAPRFCSNSGSDVNIYKLYDPNQYKVVVVTPPNKLEYKVGDPIDLTGLEIEIRSQAGNVDVAYNNETAEYFVPETSTAYGSGDVVIEVTYQEKRFVIQITIVRDPEEEAYYSRRIGQLADYRGSYMLADVETGAGINVESAITNGVSGSYFTSFDHQHSDSNTYCVDNSGDYERLRFHLTKDNAGYHLLDSEEEYYLDLDNLCMTNEATPVVVIEHTNAGERVRSTTGKYLYFNDYTFKVGAVNVGDPVYLFKYDLSSAEQATLDSYIVDNFLHVTDLCDENGLTFEITESLWNGLAYNYSVLADALQAEIVNTSYVVDHYETYLQFAMARYDYIYQKYHSNPNYTYITDFIGRNTAGTMQNLYVNNVLPVINNSNSDMVSAIIITVAISSLLLVSFFIYKKKSNR